jgi:hypothetical protein
MMLTYYCIVQGVKVGKKQTLNLDRFKEAMRRIAVKIDCTYYDLIRLAAGSVSVNFLCWHCCPAVCSVLVCTVNLFFLGLFFVA